MATTKFDLQQFDGHINFGIWKVRLMAVLVQQNLKATLDVKRKRTFENGRARMERY